MGAGVALLTLRLGNLYVALVTLTFGLLMERLVFTRQVFYKFGVGVALHRPSFATGDRALAFVALGVFVLMIYYNFKIKGAGGFLHELLSAPFGSHPLLWIPNLALNIIEFVAKTVSLGMRLFGNMYAGELLFLLIALLGSLWNFGADTTVLGFIGHVIAGSVWAVFHILIVLLQAFIFMMLTLVYIGQAHDTH